MGKRIQIISVAIALMFLATMPIASSDANEGGKVWSDGYVELTLNKMERTETVPPEFIGPLDLAKPPPRDGHDFVVINLTATRIEGRYVVPPSSSSILFDDKGNNYTCGGKVRGITLRTEKGVHQEEFTPEEFAEAYVEVVEGSEWLLYSEMPKDRELVLLRVIYDYTESWENVSIKEGKIEIYLQVRPTPAPIMSPTPKPLPTPESTVTPTLSPTPPGFKAIFALAGLLTVAYLLRRRK